MFFLISADFLETFTHLCFKKGVLSRSAFAIHNISDIFVFLQGVFSSPFIWFGLFSVFTTFIIWATLLSKIDLSVAVPICSFSYMLIPLASLVFLHEKISLLRWAGVLLILLGVVYVSLSSADKEPLPK